MFVQGAPSRRLNAGSVSGRSKLQNHDQMGMFQPMEQAPREPSRSADRQQVRSSGDGQFRQTWPCRNLRIKFSERILQAAQRFDQNGEARARGIRHARRRILNLGNELFNMRRTLRRNQTIFRQVTADRIDQLGALAHKDSGDLLSFRERLRRDRAKRGAVNISDA